MDIKLNWYALLVAIECNCNSDHAFEKLDGIYKHKMTAEDVADMKALKEQGATYPELQEIFGFNKHYICRIVKGGYVHSA